MNGKLFIISKMDYKNKAFDINITSNYFSLVMYVDEDKTFDYQLKNKDEFITCMDEIKNNYKKLNENVYKNDKKYLILLVILQILMNIFSLISSVAWSKVIETVKTIF